VSPRAEMHTAATMRDPGALLCRARSASIASPPRAVPPSSSPAKVSGTWPRPRRCAASDRQDRVPGAPGRPWTTDATSAPQLSIRRPPCSRAVQAQSPDRDNAGYIQHSSTAGPSRSRHATCLSTSPHLATCTHELIPAPHSPIAALAALRAQKIAGFWCRPDGGRPRLRKS